MVAKSFSVVERVVQELDGRISGHAGHENFESCFSWSPNSWSGPIGAAHYFEELDHGCQWQGPCEERTGRTARATSGTAETKASMFGHECSTMTSFDEDRKDMRNYKKVPNRTKETYRAVHVAINKRGPLPNIVSNNHPL